VLDVGVEHIHIISLAAASEAVIIISALARLSPNRKMIRKTIITNNKGVKTCDFL
jgi:hypothetical protein